jgi:hypothetical protein
MLVYVTQRPNALAPVKNEQVAQNQAPRDPDTLYQYGKPIGTVQGAVEDRAHSTVMFQAVRANGSGDPNQEIEYRDLVIRCDELPAPPKGAIVGHFVGLGLGVKCRIIRNR